jgi:hypothetical protein
VNLLLDLLTEGKELWSEPTTVRSSGENRGAVAMWFTDAASSGEEDGDPMGPRVAPGHGGAP